MCANEISRIRFVLQSVEGENFLLCLVYVGREADGNKHPNMIDIGERAGGGIPNIYDICKKREWNTPVLTEVFEPKRIE